MRIYQSVNETVPRIKSISNLKKNIVISLMFLISLFISHSVFSQESNVTSQIYENYKDSIFLVNQSIYLDENKIKNIDLFKKLETAMDKKVLNQYIPIVNGTAFLVNDQGYLISAFHVVKYLTMNEKIEYGMWSFQEYLSKNMIPGYLTMAETRIVFREYMSIVVKSEIVVSLKSNNRKDYRGQIIAHDDNLDLVLLKIDLDTELQPVKVRDNKNLLKVGDTVVTIGYPLQYIMDSFLDDFKPTVTNGIVSAIRDDNWDIQHTASLNRGNSGGPLFNSDGELVGVNVGGITDANNIYFSTNSGKVIEWLKDIKKYEIIKIE